MQVSLSSDVGMVSLGNCLNSVFHCHSSLPLLQGLCPTWLLSIENKLQELVLRQALNMLNKLNYGNLKTMAKNLNILIQRCYHHASWDLVIWLPHVPVILEEQDTQIRLHLP